MATPQLNYFYRISVTRVKDGDTLEAVFDLGFRASLAVTVRLLNVDAPETWRPSSLAEGEAGKKVTTYLQQILDANKGKLFCTSHSIDVYGRSLGTLYYQDANNVLTDINAMLNSFMVAEGLTQSQFKGTINQ